MEDVLSSLTALGIDFDKPVSRLIRLHQALEDEKSRQAYLQDEDENTILSDILIKRLRHEIDIESKRIKQKAESQDADNE